MFQKRSEQETLAAEIHKKHRLVRRGRFWMCSHCGQVFSWAKTQREGEIQLAIHKKSVIELLENQQAGISHYGEE